MESLAREEGGGSAGGRGLLERFGGGGAGSFSSVPISVAVCC